MQTLDQVVAESPVFAGMAPAELAQIAGCASTAGFAEGETLFREGDPADVFYLVRRGRVALDVHTPGREPLTIETVEPGDIVGWSWLFAPYRWHFDGRAVESTRLVAFDGACLRGKCERDHSLGYELLTRFSAVMLDRLQSTRLRLLDVYGSARSN